VSTFEQDPERSGSGGVAVAVESPGRQVLVAREVPLGGPRMMLVRRTLPHRDRRTVGAWCFVDHFGPQEASDAPVMHVPPHPHTGLQTVTWLIEGEVLHQDSLGSVQRIEPGELNLMTAGHGIAHAEDSVAGGPPRLHGLQLWVALPDADRHQQPHFEHHARLPVLRDGTVTTTVIIGELAGERSAALSYSPLLAAEVVIAPGGGTRLPAEPEFEHAVLAVTGSPMVDGVAVPTSSMLYLGPGRRDLSVGAEQGARLLLLGGTPFAENLLMWWNFVARDHDEIAQARADWEAGRRFGRVSDYPGDPLAAPAMPTTRLLPRPSHP
jgi:redox-sensitive bicupin YhaK (pirin superfamily)